MTKRPWMPLYVSDYLADNRHLTMAEHGAFLLLVMWRFQKGRLPQDDRELANLVRLSKTKWLKIRDKILALMSERDCSGRTGYERVLGVGHFDSRPSIPKDIRAAVFRRDGMKCVYCGEERGPFDLDHRVPWSRGGEDSVENLTVACRACNRSKGSLTNDEWTRRT